MPSNNTTLIYERERTQRYAHQGAAGSPDYNMARNGHLPHDDTFQTHKAEAEKPFLSRSKRKPGYETPVPNCGPTNDQLDGCFESDDYFQRLPFLYPGHGEDDHGRNCYGAQPEPHRGDFIHSTHSKHEPRMRYLEYLARDKSPSEEDIRYIGKEQKWQRDYHGPYDAGLLDRDRRRRGQCVRLVPEKPSKQGRGRFSIFRIYESDKECTGPSWCLTSKGQPLDPKGSNFDQPDGFSDSSSHAHPHSQGDSSLQQLFQDYYRFVADRCSGSSRNGHGGDAEDESSSPEHYQATFRDAAGANVYLHEEKQALHGTEAVEHTLLQGRADFERRCAERVTTKVHPQMEQAEAQQHENHRYKGKEPTTTNGIAHRPDEANIQHGEAEYSQANDFPHVTNRGSPNTVHEVYGRIVNQPQKFPGFREVERACLEARLRATRQAADEAYLALSHHDSVDEEAAMRNYLPAPEEMMPGGQAYQGPVNTRPA